MNVRLELILSMSPDRRAYLRISVAYSPNHYPHVQTPIVPSSGRTSPGPPPGMLKQVLLGNTGDFEEQEDMSIARARVSSMSGRPVHQLGMAIVIGDMSSSESEEEESNLMSSYGTYVRPYVVN